VVMTCCGGPEAEAKLAFAQLGEYKHTDHTPSTAPLVKLLFSATLKSEADFPAFFNDFQGSRGTQLATKNTSSGDGTRLHRLPEILSVQA
jgi:hypothetical protein